MQIVTKSKRIETVSYSMSFEDLTCSGAGWGFPCDEFGNIFTHELQEPGKENLKKCLSGEFPISPGKVVKYTNSYTEPAVGRCDCGCLVSLEGFTNTCDVCGADYTISGQRLAPREQWGDDDDPYYDDDDSWDNSLDYDGILYENPW